MAEKVDRWVGPWTRKRVPATALAGCAHLGKDTGRTAACVENCGKGMKLKVFECAVHGQCTVAKNGEGVPGRCRDCPDHSGQADALNTASWAPKGARPVLVLQPPPLDLTPKSTRAVVTVVVGAEAEALHAISGPFQRAYAERVGADYVILRWPGHPGWGMSCKYAVGRVLDHYERLASFDVDCLLRPDAVNVYDLCAPEEFGAVDELPHSRAFPEYGQERRYRAYRARTGHAPIEVPWYINAGVVVASRCHQPFLLPPARPLLPGHCEEQDCLNARLHDASRAGTLRYRLLDRRANWQSWTDCSRGVFASAPPDAILHFSGGGELRRRRLDDMRRFTGG